MLHSKPPRASDRLFSSVRLVLYLIATSVYLVTIKANAVKKSLAFDFNMKKILVIINTSILLVTFSLPSFSGSWLDSLSGSDQIDLASDKFLDYAFKIRVQENLAEGRCLSANSANELIFDLCNNSLVKKWRYTRFQQLITEATDNNGKNHYYCAHLPTQGTSAKKITLRLCDLTMEKHQRFAIVEGKIQPGNYPNASLGSLRSIRNNYLVMNGTHEPKVLDVHIDTTDQNTVQLFTTPLQPYLQFKTTIKDSSNNTLYQTANSWSYFGDPGRRELFFNGHYGSLISNYGFNDGSQVFCQTNKLDNNYSNTYDWTTFEECSTKGPTVPSKYQWLLYGQQSGAYNIKSTRGHPFIMNSNNYAYTAGTEYSSSGGLLDMTIDGPLKEWAEAIGPAPSYYDRLGAQAAVEGYFENLMGFTPQNSCALESRSVHTRAIDDINYQSAGTLKPLRSGQVRVYWLNVGQGTAIVIDGHGWANPIIIDAGALPDSENIRVMTRDQVRSTVMAILSRNGTIAPRRPIVTVSHADQDHYNLLPYIFNIDSSSDVHPLSIYLGGSFGANYSAVFRAWVLNQTSYHNTDLYDQLSIDSTTEQMTGRTNEENRAVIGNSNNILNSTPIVQSFLRLVTSDYAATGPNASNRQSLVFNLQVGPHLSVNFMGDANGAVELNAINALNAMQLNRPGGIMTASHHGANTHGSNGQVLADFARAAVLMMTVGAKDFQHPRLSTICNYAPYLVNLASHYIYNYDAAANDGHGAFTDADDESTTAQYSTQEVGAVVATITVPGATGSNDAINNTPQTDVEIWNGGSDGATRVNLASRYMQDNSGNQ